MEENKEVAAEDTKQIDQAELRKAKLIELNTEENRKISKIFL